MRVAVLAQNDLTRDSRVLREARSLVSAGHRVALVGIASRGLERRGEKDSIRFVRLAIPDDAPTKVRFTLYAIKAAAWLIHHPQRVVQACDADTLLPAFLGHGIFGKPVVYDSHELYTDLDVLVGRAFERRAWWIVERVFAPASVRVVAVSRMIARELRARYGLSDVAVVRNFPDAHERRPRPDALDDALSAIPTGAHVVFHHGILNPGRGLRTLVRAFAKVNGAHRLVIVGHGPLRDELVALSRSLYVSDRVHVLEPVSADRVSSLASRAHVGVHLLEDVSLNNRYALPNKVFAYLHAGLPVVVTDLPELRGLLEPFGCARFVPSGDEYAAARAIGELVEDGEARERAIEGARRAAAVLRWENEEAAYLEVFEGLSR